MQNKGSKKGNGEGKEGRDAYRQGGMAKEGKLRHGDNVWRGKGEKWKDGSHRQGGGNNRLISQEPLFAEFLCNYTLLS